MPPDDTPNVVLDAFPHGSRRPDALRGATSTPAPSSARRRTPTSRGRGRRAAPSPPRRTAIPSPDIVAPGSGPGLSTGTLAEDRRRPLRRRLRRESGFGSRSARLGTSGFALRRPKPGSHERAELNRTCGAVRTGFACRGRRLCSGIVPGPRRVVLDMPRRRRGGLRERAGRCVRGSRAYADASATTGPALGGSPAARADGVSRPRALRPRLGRLPRNARSRVVRRFDAW